jgi:hypothetical protein
VKLALYIAAFWVAGAGDIFKWVDKEGHLHATQTLADVPEPYYSMYAAELRRREEAKRNAPSDAPPAIETVPESPRPEVKLRGTASQIEAQQKKWRQLVAEHRAALASATAALEAIDSEIEQAGANPVLRETPQARAKLAELAEKRAEQLTAVENARRMLLEDLPKQAKKEGVPPRWLD